MKSATYFIFVILLFSTNCFLVKQHQLKEANKAKIIKEILSKAHIKIALLQERKKDQKNQKNKIFSY